MAYEDEVLALSPFAYWRLDEESGTTAVDETGNYDGVYNGSPSLDQPPLITTGRAVGFIGNDSDYAEVTDPPDAFIGDFSIAAWVNINTPPDVMCILSRHTTPSGVQLSVNADRAPAIGGRSEAGVFHQAVDSENPLSVGETVFLVGYREGSVWGLYVNGAFAVSEDVGSTGSANGDTTLTIGRNSPNNGNHFPFDGEIDEVAVWDRALTTQEIADLYEAGTTVSVTASASLQATSTITAAASAAHATSLTLPATGAFTASPDPSYTRSARFDATGALTAAPDPFYSRQARLDATGILAASATVQLASKSGAASLSAQGGLVSSHARDRRYIAVLSVVGGFSTTPSIERPAKGVLPGVSVVSAPALRTRGAAVRLHGDAVLFARPDDILVNARNAAARMDARAALATDARVFAPPHRAVWVRVEEELYTVGIEEKPVSVTIERDRWAVIIEQKNTSVEVEAA